MSKKSSNIKNTISMNVKKYRLLNNLTQSQLAELLFLDTQYYSQLERGERNFTIEKLILLSDIFQVGIDKLITTYSYKEVDNSDMIQKICSQIPSLTTSQLKALDRMITDILPFID